LSSSKLVACFIPSFYNSRQYNGIITKIALENKKTSLELGNANGMGDKNRKNRMHGCMKRSRKTKDNFHFLCMQIGKIYCCGKGRWDYCTQKEKEPQYLVFNILVHTKYRGFHSNKKSSDAFLTGGQPSCERLLQRRCNIGAAIAGAAIVVPFVLSQKMTI